MDGFEQDAQLETFVGIGGQLRFKCPDCEFDSYSEGLVLEHWLGTHNDPQTTPAKTTTLFDAENKPLTVERVINMPEALKNLL